MISKEEVFKIFDEIEESINLLYYFLPKEFVSGLEPFITNVRHKIDKIEEEKRTSDEELLKFIRYFNEMNSDVLDNNGSEEEQLNLIKQLKNEH